MTEIKQNKMGVMPVGKLLLSMSLPAMFSMLIQALYNIVDTIYISQISEEAVFTMTIVFPMQMILISLALGGAIGTSTLVARRLGQGQHEEANKTASTGLILSIFHSVICALVGIFLTKPFLALFTTDAQIIAMGFDYLSIVMGVAIGVYVGMFFERLSQAQGNMILPMCSLLIGAITNIILDPIFIFGWWIVPAMGIKGAAIATVIGQVLGMLFISAAMLIGKHEVKLQFKGLHLRWSRIRDIYAIGLPVTVMNMVGAFANMALNAVVVAYSQLAVSALGLYFKLSSFVFMPVFGLNQGALPILSFNYGSQDKKRYSRVVQLFFWVAVVIMAIGTVFFWLQTDLLISMFEVSPALQEMTRTVLRTISLCFVVFGISIVLSTIFQSLGKAFTSMMMSLLRQMILLVPLAYLLGQAFGVNGIWYTYLISEVVVVLSFTPYCYKVYKQAFAKE
ncbi:MAG: MATE family efflux transporter [Anaerorhabdus sp.]